MRSRASRARSSTSSARSTGCRARSGRAPARSSGRTSSSRRRLQRSPTEEELAAELELPIDEFRDALLEIANSSISALDELWTSSDSSGDSISLLDTLRDPGAIDPEHVVDQNEMRDRIAEAVDRLPEREKLVIALYYYENLTLREIGEVLA